MNCQPPIEDQMVLDQQGNKNNMEYLAKHPDMTIAQVARLCNVSESILRDEQLAFLKSNLKRNNKLWDIPSYGK